MALEHSAGVLVHIGLVSPRISCVLEDIVTEFSCGHKPWMNLACSECRPDMFIDQRRDPIKFVKGGEAMKIELGAVFNIGSYNSARVSVEVEAPTYEEAYSEARKMFYRTAFAHVKELTIGLKGKTVVDFLAENLDVEPQ